MKRTQEHVKQEYTDKWSVAKDAKTIEEARDALLKFAINCDYEVVSSYEMDLVLSGRQMKGTWDDYKRFQSEIIRQTLEPFSGSNFCELGCGPGYQLSYITDLGGELYGGEYIKEAVEVAQKFGLDVRQFNYYSLEDYQMLRPNTVIFTVHSVEQIPDATPILEGLRSQKDKIKAVVHFEPLVTENEDQNAYLAEKDYNQNLAQLLEAADDIEITYREDGVLGGHPRNVMSVLSWQFK